MIVPTEAQEQATLFDWAASYAVKYPEIALMYHTPNGGSRNAREAHNLRLQGVKPGVPDICLPVARKGYHGLYIEMKRRKGGRVSPDQERMLAALNDQGYKAVVCYGADEAMATITDYMAIVGKRVDGIQPF